VDAIGFNISALFLGLVGAGAAAIAITLTVRGLRRGARSARSANKTATPAIETVAPAIETVASAIKTGGADRPPEPPEPAPPPPVLREPEPAAIEAFLFAADAPPTLLFPLHLTKGRILEISLPLTIRSTGGRDAQSVLAQAKLPNEITFGASLDRMAANERGHDGPQLSYAFTGRSTTISIRVANLQPGEEATINVPISVKPGVSGTGRLELAISFAGGPMALRDYRVELIDLGPRPVGEDGARDQLQGEIERRRSSPGEAWICWPDETSRVREAGQPIDRIASMNFDIQKP
jgi:hypothetical protein